MAMIAQEKGVSNGKHMWPLGTPQCQSTIHQLRRVDAVLLADVTQEVPIMVLDELDSGVGARLGGVMGRLLQRMAATSLSQLLCITHLPQVNLWTNPA